MIFSLGIFYLGTILKDDILEEEIGSEA